MASRSHSPQTLHLASLAGELRISLSKLIRRVREQAHPGDFTSAQKSVLLRLERDGPATVSALARAESVRPQSMRVTVASLEAMQAVRGEPDSADGRKNSHRPHTRLPQNHQGQPRRQRRLATARLEGATDPQ